MKKILLAGLISTAALSHANEYEANMVKHFNDVAQNWLNNPIVVNAIKAQNIKHSGLDETAIIALDTQWRDGVSGGDTSLIDTTLANELSGYLQEVEMNAEGLYTEIFVMDNKGLNVGQSSITSDYWQGDEGKFSKSYGMGAGAIFVDDIEEDESTQLFQSQMSGTIVDENGQAIGAVTIGINVDEL